MEKTEAQIQDVSARIMNVTGISETLAVTIANDQINRVEYSNDFSSLEIVMFSCRNIINNLEEMLDQMDGMRVVVPEGETEGEKKSGLFTVTFDLKKSDETVISTKVKIVAWDHEVSDILKRASEVLAKTEVVEGCL